MKSISDNELGNVSFPDCEVAFFEVASRSLRLQLNGIHIENQGFFDLQVHVRVFDWSAAICEKFDANGGSPIEVPLVESEGLREVCEWEFTDNKLKIAGFSRMSGRWEQLCFLDPKVEILLEEKNR